MWIRRRICDAFSPNPVRLEPTVCWSSFESESASRSRPPGDSLGDSACWVLDAETLAFNRFVDALRLLSLAYSQEHFFGHGDPLLHGDALGSYGNSQGPGSCRRLARRNGARSERKARAVDDTSLGRFSGISLTLEVDGLHGHWFFHQVTPPVAANSHALPPQLTQHPTHNIA
jgi:hypothetical protein